ncbi:transposable element Tc1 transposase [Trichonephila clavipes]|nr:transposable element Tc1 transposase [Trichonephila clavipes]
MILCVAGYWKDRRRAKNNRCFAREFDIAHSVVSRLRKSFKTTGMCSRRHGGGRVRSTTPAEDRYIVLSAKGTGAPQLSRGGGLYARRPVVCVPLTRQHRAARLQRCREHGGLNRTGHAYYSQMRVGFSLSSDCRRQLIWREWYCLSSENIQEKDRYPTCSIMVWVGIMINGRTRLHVVANGTMTGQRYIDETLLPHVRLFRGASVINLFYGRQRNMSSNTRCSGLSRQRGVFNVSYGQRVLQI